MRTLTTRESKQRMRWVTFYTMALSVMSVAHGQVAEPDLSGFIRDTIDIKGKSLLSTHRDTIRRIDMSIVHPYPVWLGASVSDLGVHTNETIGYGPILHSLHMERGTKGHPMRMEVQLMDSAYLEIEFHYADSHMSGIGHFKKYYGQYDSLRCIDQEDPAWIAREKQCQLRYSRWLGWEEPCHAPVGEWRHYWPNGVLESRGHFHPKEFEAVQAGTVESKGETLFVQTLRNTRVKVGKWEYFDESGNLIRTIDHVPVWLGPKEH